MSCGAATTTTATTAACPRSRLVIYEGAEGGNTNGYADTPSHHGHNCCIARSTVSVLPTAIAARFASFLRKCRYADY